MASNSHQKSSSSARSSSRKLTHVGNGTQSRERSGQPKVEVDTHGGRARAGRASGRRQGSGGSPRPSSSARDPRRKPSEKQAQRDRARAAQKRSLIKNGAILVGAVLVVWVAWTAVASSGLFAIEQVTVEGAEELSVDEIVTRAAIEPGETLLGLDVSAVVVRLEGLPWIESASVVRRYPSTALLRIKEREQFVILDLGATFWALDSSARVLGVSMPTTATAIPVLRDVPAFDPVPGEIVSADEVKNAIKVLAGITPELRGTVRTVSSPRQDETALITDTSIEIMIGRAEQLSEKSALALEIMAEQGSSVVFIDVRSLERPVSRGLND